MNPKDVPYSDRLYSLLAEGQIEPGSKRLSLGLDHHNPIEAVQYLAGDEVAMSIALHELTHFHSLTNDIGTVITALGLLRALAAEDLKVRVTERRESIEGALFRYFQVNERFTMMLEAWRPLLEGIAIYVQTSYPCVQVEEQMMPVDTLVGWATALHALDPTPFSGPVDLDMISMGMQSATERALKQGPQIPVEGSSLAVALELGTYDWSLPYFLGHAYVRGLQNRLQRTLAGFQCPELFLGVLLQILNHSSPLLLGAGRREASLWNTWYLYGWMPMFERASPDRIYRLPDLVNTNYDVLTWLRDGDLVITNSTTVGETFEFLEQVIPDELEMGFRGQRNLEEALGGFNAHTFSINLCSGGSCRVLGWIPEGFEGIPVIAVRVGEHTWWLALRDAELAVLQLQERSLPNLTKENARALVPPPDAPTLRVGCFLTHLGIGLTPNNFNRHFVFEFSSPDNEEESLVAEIVAGPGRGVLMPVSSEIASIHTSGEHFRDMLTTVPDLGTWGHWLSSQGYSENARQVQKVAAGYRIELQKLRDEWSSWIISGLLGYEQPSSIRSMIQTQHLRALIPENVAVEEILTGTYAAQRAIRGVPFEQIKQILEAVNRRSITLINKRLFKWDNGENVRYTGLWDS